MSINSGTPFDWLFALLTERMGVLHTAAPDVGPSQRGRVEWARSGDLSFERSPYRPAGQKTAFRMLHPWSATVYGASDLEVSSRTGELMAWLEELIGPEQGVSPTDVTDGREHHGYVIKPGKPAFRGGDGISLGWSCTSEVTLRTLVPALIYPPHAVATATVTTTTTAPDGSGAEVLAG